VKGERQMAIPEQLLITFEPYPALTFIPLGRKNKTVRSLGTKHIKGLLTRMNDGIEAVMNNLSEEDKRLLSAFLYENKASGFPIPIGKKDELHPSFWKPETFLWKGHNEHTGIPIHSEQFYPETFTKMSKEELTPYIEKVVNDYMFCARVHDSTRDEWLKHINKKFFEHPLISLYHEHKETIEGAEKVKRSPLLFLMKDPDQVAFWRGRVEIIMRPFRSLTYEVFHNGLTSCPHGIHLSFHSAFETIHAHCDRCHISFTYDVANNEVTLKEEFDVRLASKRIATMKRQFHEMMRQNGALLEKLKLLQQWKTNLAVYKERLDEIWDVRKQVNLYALQEKQNLLPATLVFIQAILDSDIPKQEGPPSISWFAQWHVPDVSLLNEMYDASSWMKEPLLEETIQHLLENEQKRLLQTKQDLLHIPAEIGHIQLLPSQLPLLLELVDTLGKEENQQMYSQILMGMTTSSMRQKQFDRLSAFGLFSSFKLKHLLPIFDSLQAWGLIQKEKQGFSLTSKGIHMYAYLSKQAE
jgi:hypothetical protein